MSASFHNRTALPAISWTFGALSFPLAIQNCRVARGTPCVFATSTVVQSFWLICALYTSRLDTCQQLF
jgi:hypothetical protein